MVKQDLVFISQWGSDLKGINGGNVKKALSQIKCFENNDFVVKQVIKDPPKYTPNPTIVDRIVTKAKNILPFFTNQKIIKYSEIGRADCYYIRFYAYDVYMYRLFKRIKKENPHCKVILEYPDYPYLTLSGNDPIGDFLVRWRDQFEKHRSMRYIDRIATLLDCREIDGKSCLRIFNGFDVDTVSLKKVMEHKDEIHVLIVASLQPAHGVDLFIEGMKKYYSKKHNIRVYLHIVGGGSILNSIVNSAKPLGDKVVFHGFLHGEELNEIYDLCDIGLEILAPHRKEIAISASLKSREYISRGMPFVSACELDICSLGYDEYCRIKDSEEPVNIDNVINYYSDFKSMRVRKMAQMRHFAEQYLNMDYSMHEVIDFLHGNS